MDLHWKVFGIVMLILTNNTNICLHGSPTEGNVINSELTGQELIKMGNKLNKPLLSLIGATFMKSEKKMNQELSEKLGDMKKTLQGGMDKLRLDASKELEVAEKKLQSSIDKLTLDATKEREVLKIELCKLTRCAAWTKWSSCSAKKNGTFGARTRSRTCGGNGLICSTKSTETVVKDYQICQGKTACKHTLTKNNYCIKLYGNVRKTRADAKDDCHKDGGHLMNIDSALKARDIEDYIRNLSLGASIWIDGTRTLPNGDWKYEYGSKDTTFSFWGNREPGVGDDCKVFGSTYRKWYGVPCTGTFYSLCEIV